MQPIVHYVFAAALNLSCFGRHGRRPQGVQTLQQQGTLLREQGWYEEAERKF